MGFNSWMDFDDFERNVKYKNRFVHSPEVDEFLRNIKRTLPARESSLPINSILYRAQIGHVEEDIESQTIFLGHSVCRMKPIPYKCSEGRANPRGIAYLYLSNDEDTSLAELRPVRGQTLSSAKFLVKKNLRLVNCYSVPVHYSEVTCCFNPPQSQEEITNAVWSMINNAFSKPVANTDSSADYVPTQFLAEFFRSEGFDGLCFKSGMGKGHNITLFNLDDADLIENSSIVMEVKSVEYKFEKCWNQNIMRREDK